ncbi:hypothetical protein MRB53_015128 [Persea americana]|uniref:Uncharacterized protein n=1 Tax=Persea americana TaxID=3435 RepID=A0ACC2KCR6_PERAE|nr:hypothetical protein MRB53_015128 [Persea americana]
MDTTFSSFSATIFFFYALLLIPSSSGRIFDEFIFPNFTATNLRFVDNSGAFLSSPNATFTVSICNPSSQSNFYLCVIHSKSNTIIWSANCDSPISNSDSMTLTQNGISITRSNGSVVWSTPPSPSPVSALRLLENGNLMLLDRYNASMWQSFDYPTDTVVMGQPIYVGRMLRSPVSDSDLSTGDYRFYVTSEDAVLQWESQDYWKLSMETRAFKNSNLEISFMEMNRSGLYLFNGNGSVVVWQMIFSSPSSDFVFAKLDYKGRFNVFLFSGTSQNAEFTAPADDCGLPNTCGEMGLCRDGLGCTCPSGFRASTTAAGGCVPSNGNGLSDCSSNSSSYSYMELADGTQYFANKFVNPTTSRSDLNTCRDLCSKNCSCLGFFYTNSSGSCYLLRNRLGSVFTSSSNSDEDDKGYVKTVVNGSPTEATNSANSEQNSGGSLPIWALILIPCVVVFFLIILSSAAFLWWRRWQVSKTMTIKLGQPNSSSSSDFDPISIPGLPVRFKYEELESATNNFRIQIGSGGFGSVYKGTLPDKTVVAVKKISNIGVQGKKEFCTEIAVIGNIHHVNLGQVQVQVRSHGEESGGSSSSSGSETDYFPLFALEMHEQGKYLELADPRLEGRVASEQVEKLVRIALCCVHEEPMLRPSMATVVAMLEGGLPLGEPRVESLNFLRFYGRRFTEPAMGEGGGENGFLYRVGTTSLTSSSSGTHAAWSYLSSQVVSGPR